MQQCAEKTQVPLDGNELFIIIQQIYYESFHNWMQYLIRVKNFETANEAAKKYVESVEAMAARITDADLSAKMLT